MRLTSDVEIEPLAIMAREYVALVEGDLGGPDGMGRYVHERYGVSHRMMYQMQVKYGVKETSDAIDAAFNKRKAHAKATPVQG